MSYQRERDQFIACVSKEGLDMPTISKLLRYASTLQRLAVAQCNGDWPFNGDRDRPSRTFKPCHHCNATGTTTPRPHVIGTGVENTQETCHYANHGGCRFDDCFCQGTGKLQTNGRERMSYDARYTVCPKCETSGVRITAMRQSSEWWQMNGGIIAHDPTGHDSKRKRAKVCPDCRTQELVTALLRVQQPRVWPVFGGDPRGAVLRLSTPGYPYEESGKGGAYGLVVPARER